MRVMREEFPSGYLCHRALQGMRRLPVLTLRDREGEQCCVVSPVQYRPSGPIEGSDPGFDVPLCGSVPHGNHGDGDTGDRG